MAHNEIEFATRIGLAISRCTLKELETLAEGIGQIRYEFDEGRDRPNGVFNVAYTIEKALGRQIEQIDPEHPHVRLLKYGK